MDPQNNQINNNTVSPTPGTNVTTAGIAQDYLVTQKVDTNTISSDQLSKDLAALKSAELTTDTEVKLNAKIIAPQIRNEDLPLKRVKEIDVLKLKNPFRGI